MDAVNAVFAQDGQLIAGQSIGIRNTKMLLKNVYLNILICNRRKSGDGTQTTPKGKPIITRI